MRGLPCDSESGENPIYLITSVSLVTHVSDYVAPSVDAGSDGKGKVKMHPSIQKKMEHEITELLSETNSLGLQKKNSTTNASITGFDKRTKDFAKTGIVAHLKAQKNDGQLKGPWNLEICPTSSCCFSCNFCSYSSRNQRRYKLDRTRIFELLEDAKEMGVVGSYFSGGGEPLMYDGIVEAIDYAADFSEVFVQTNAYYLDRLLSHGENWFKNKINLISVSLYGHNQEQYERMGSVPKNAFEKIRENIKEALKIKEVHISCKIVLCQENYKAIRDMYELAEDLGATTIHVRPVNNYEPGQNVKLRKKQLFEAAKLISPKDTKIGDFLKQLCNRHISFAQNIPCFTTREGHNGIVETDGFFYICIPSDGYPKFAIGNINEKRLRYIWNSKEHCRIIQELPKSNICDPQKCRHFNISTAIQEYSNNSQRVAITLEELYPYGSI